MEYELRAVEHQFGKKLPSYSKKLADFWALWAIYKAPNHPKQQAETRNSSESDRKHYLCQL
jgi:hypothetical protein